ncbi:microtubule-associated protein 65-5 isoform X2 [Wolffia australiana]
MSNSDMILPAMAEATTCSSMLKELQMEKRDRNLKEKVAMTIPELEDLRLKRDTRLKQFMSVQTQIAQIQSEISGNSLKNSHSIDQRDLSQIRLEELKSQLRELQLNKNRRLEEVAKFLHGIHELSGVISVDFSETIRQVHPSFVDFREEQPKSISDETLSRFNGSIKSLMNVKKQRLQKLQFIGANIVELWHLMETPVEEQKKFDFVTRFISQSADEIVEQGCLSVDVIEQAQAELDRLNVLKSSKMKDIIMKKQLELEAIYDSAHIYINGDDARLAINEAIDSGEVDVSQLLSAMEDEIEKARELALSRKEILDKVEKWRFASEEEHWLDDYEQDHNRYNAVKGSHKNLKRAEKARKLVAKLPSIVQSLVAKVQAWERERECLFLYDKERLLDVLEQYSLLRHQIEEEKRRSREQRKLHEQLATEQEMMFGSKRSPLTSFSGKKPLGQSSHMNMNMNMNMNGRILTPLGRHGGASSTMGMTTMANKGGGKTGKVAAVPVNYVALAKEASSLSPSSVAPSP